MKVRIVAHISDVHGSHVPGDIVDLGEGEAEAYVKKGWAKFEDGLNPPKEEPKPEEPPEDFEQKQADMETAENFKRETAVMPRQRGRKIKAK